MSALYREMHTLYSAENKLCDRRLFIKFDYHLHNSYIEINTFFVKKEPNAYYMYIVPLLENKTDSVNQNSQMTSRISITLPH